MKHCKICGSLCQDDATRCAYCNSDFSQMENTYGKRGSDHVKTPVEGFAVCLLLLAISFLPTIPIALSVGAYLAAEYTLMISWVFIFIVSLIVYRFAVNNAHTAQKYYARFHSRNDEISEQEAMYENTSAAQDEEELDTTDAFMPEQLSNSEFSAALYDACRNTNFSELPQYDANMSCAVAGDCLTGRFAKQPQCFDATTARTLLAALAARRMVLLCGNDRAELDRAVSNVAKLTGESTCTVKISRNCATPTDLYTSGTAGEVLPSPFLCAIFNARARQKSILPILLDAEAPEKLGKAMADLKPYLENGMIEEKIAIKGANRIYGDFVTDEIVSLPANTRLLFAYRPGSSSPMPRDMMDVCAFVNLKNGMASGETLNAMVGALSFERFLRLCDESEDRFGLSEETWKKIDDLGEKLAAERDFALDNKLITAMERFVGVYIAAGGSEQEALDGVLATLVLPVALTCRAANGDNTGVSTLLDACFGLENLPACAEMLKKFSAA